MCDLHEAAENIARMEAAYKATGIPRAPDVRRCADELRPIPDPKPSTTVENVSLAIGLATVAGVLAGVLS